MQIQKTRVVIASIVLIVALSLALRGRIIWDEITQWVTAYTVPLSIPAAVPDEVPEEKNKTIEQLPSAETNLNQALSSAQISSEEIQIIPTPKIVQELFEQIQHEETPQKKPRVARRRRKKEIQDITISEPIVPVMEIQPTLELIAPIEAIAPTTSPVTPAPWITKQEEVVPVAQQKIHVYNKINLTDLAVKHWSGTYSPTKLVITLNGIPFILVGENPIAMEAAQEIPCTDNCITVHYAYEFLHGVRTGSDTITYTLAEQRSQLTLHFSWDTPWHVELSGAQRTQ